MTLKAVMNTAGRLGHSAGSTITGGYFAVLSTPSVKVSAGGLPVYRDRITFSFIGGNAPGFSPGTVFAVQQQYIEPTATKTRIDGLAPIREGDGLPVTNFVGTLLSGSFSKLVGPIEVVDAGQSKVSAQ